MTFKCNLPQVSTDTSDDGVAESVKELTWYPQPGYYPTDPTETA